MGFGRRSNQIDDELTVVLRAEAHGQPVRSARTEDDPRVGFECRAPFTYECPGESHLDDRVGLEMGDLLAVAPVRLGVPEHRFRRNDTAHTTELTVEQGA